MNNKYKLYSKYLDISRKSSFINALLYYQFSKYKKVI